MSKFGTSQPSYSGYDAEIDAPGAKSENGNVTSWTGDPEEIVKLLFKGTENASGGKFEEWCKDEGGSINGIGPNCVTLKETGARDNARCYYQGTMSCLELWRVGAYDASQHLIDTMEYNAFLWEAHVGEFKTYSKVNTDGFYNGGATTGSGEATCRAGYDNCVADWKNSVSDCKSSYLACIAGTVNLSSEYKSLEIPRAEYFAARMEFDACVETVQDDCECKDCVFTITTKPDDPSTEDDEPPPDDEDDDDPTGFDPLVPQMDEITTKSGFGVIPRVWGTYVVGGNIIWVSNPPRRVTSEVTYDNSATRRVTARKFDNFVDMSVGVCVGEIDAISRVWFDDALVYSGFIDLDDLRNAATDMDVSAMAPNPYDLSSLALSTPQLEVYRGGAAQKVSKTLARQIGFGRVPAYRGLAYMNIKNVNINLFGGDFPELRIEVMAKATEDKRFIASDTSDIQPDFLHVDQRTGRVYTISAAGMLSAYGWDTFELDWESEINVSSNPVTILESGYVLASSSIAFSSQTHAVYDHSFLNRVTDENYLFVEGLLSSGANGKAFLSFEEDDVKFFDVYAFIDSRGEPCYARYDYTKEELNVETNLLTSVLSAYPHSTGNLAAVGLVSVASGMKFDQYYLPSSSQTYLAISRFSISDAAGFPLYELTPDDHYETLDIANTVLWGSETSGVTLDKVVNSAVDNTLLLLFNVASRSVLVKLDAATFNVVWSVTLAGDVATFEMARSAYQKLVIAATNQDIIEVNLLTGESSVIGNLLTDTYLEFSGESQYYDGRTNSLTYTTADGNATRIFLDRISPERPSFAEIIGDLSLGAATIDASALTGVTVAGYAVTSAVSVRTFLEEVSGLYQLSLIDDGEKLRVVERSDLAAAIALDEDFVGERSTSTLTDYSITDAVQVSFASIGYEGMVNSVQTVAISGDDTPQKTAEFSVTLNEDPEIIRQLAEQLLLSIRSTANKSKFVLGPRYIGITPQDVVSWDDDVYRLNRVNTGYDDISQTEGETFSFEDYETKVSFNSVATNSNVNATRVGIAGVDRPVIFFTNAITNEDALVAMSGEQVVYTAIEAREADIVSTRVNLRVPSQIGIKYDRFDALYAHEEFEIPASPLYTSAYHTKAAHFGIVETAPSQSRTIQTDVSDEMIVEFARDDTIEFINTLSVYDSPGYDVMETPLENLLIYGQEYIKFGGYEFLGDRRVRFYDLFRGCFGTEPYIRQDSLYANPEFAFFNGAPDRVYLYTPDTIKPMRVNAAFTKRRSLSKAFSAGATPAGVRRLEYAFITDAGSARPWAPTDPTIYARSTDFTKLLFSVKRRHPMVFDGLTAGSNVPNGWGTQRFIAYEAYDDYEGNTFNATKSMLAEPLHLYHEIAADGDVIDTFEVTVTSGHTVVAIAHVAKDPEGGDVTGHPLIFQVSAARADTTYPAP